MSTLCPKFRFVFCNHLVPECCMTWKTEGSEFEPRLGPSSFLLAILDTSNLLIPGMLFIRIGGFLFYYSNMRLANFAPRIKGTIITVYAGLFDSSSSMLYIILVGKRQRCTVKLTVSRSQCMCITGGAQFGLFGPVVVPHLCRRPCSSARLHLPVVPHTKTRL